MVTVLEVIQRSSDFLQQKGVESPRLQIELMLAQVLAMPRLKLYLNFARVLSEAELDRAREMVKRRASREPLQHILGSTSFCGLEIKCSRDALVPRPETELLAERGWTFLGAPASGPARSEVAQQRAGPEAGAPMALDLGTGTGCIAIAMAVNAPQARLQAVDISSAALALARDNAARNNVSDRIEFTEGDAFNAIPPGRKFNLIASNPPYLASEEIKTLEPEVRDFDPMLALDGGGDGLAFHRRIAQEAPAFLKPNGKLMLEFADGQAEEVKKLFSAEKWIVEEIVADYSAHPRILIARRSG
ncbi:MAG TPA: peptide chain release factor N(5)-glutamine methyltransferase [Methylomirabilota bacterium]|nr:peptide chain release factor N(5)-glutamine methyltransferase [Methylomirabilota bacterium]